MYLGRKGQEQKTNVVDLRKCVCVCVCACVYPHARSERESSLLAVSRLDGVGTRETPVVWAGSHVEVILAVLTNAHQAGPIEGRGSVQTGVALVSRLPALGCCSISSVLSQRADHHSLRRWEVQAALRSLASRPSSEPRRERREETRRLGVCCGVV